jgi:hypothetical protein
VISSVLSAICKMSITTVSVKYPGLLYAQCIMSIIQISTRDQRGTRARAVRRTSIMSVSDRIALQAN